MALDGIEGHVERGGNLVGSKVAVAKLIAESIPNSKLYIFKGASHYVPVEKIDEFNEIVNSFFKAP